jgi:hypothetical protein
MMAISEPRFANPLTAARRLGLPLWRLEGLVRAGKLPGPLEDAGGLYDMVALNRAFDRISGIAAPVYDPLGQLLEKRG